MRKLVFAAAIAGSALTLAACADSADDTAEPAAEATPVGPEVADDTAMAEDGGVLDASTVTGIQLAGIGGISAELATAIVAGQPYASATDFNAVLLATLGEEEAVTVRERVFVPIDLNSATREDIALIPGMTERMIGEFLEYRPYADMSEFDREIGKYVDEAEVARFRQYVTL